MVKLIHVSKMAPGEYSKLISHMTQHNPRTKYEEVE